jgi:hypothetical protein
MKKFIIGVLVCVNLALVATLVFHAGGQPAWGQVRRGQASYIINAGQADRNGQILYVIDTNRRMMGIFRLDTTHLARDFPIQGR